MITGSVFCMEIGNAMKSTNFKGCEDKIQSPGVRIISKAKRWHAGNNVNIFEEYFKF